MQLSDILEENSVDGINKRTNISEENIEALIAGDFSKIKRIKTMGFISIIEREYNTDLSKLKEEAINYYENHREENESITLGLPIVEEKKGMAKWLKLIIFFMIIYAIWFAYSNFDKEKLNAMLPFSEEKFSQLIGSDKKSDDVSEIENVKDLSIEHVQVQNTQHDEENRSY